MSHNNIAELEEEVAFTPILSLATNAGKPIMTVRSNRVRDNFSGRSSLVFPPPVRRLSLPTSFLSWMDAQ
jgi:hypothetical protein